MTDDLASLTGRPERVTAGDETHLVSQLTVEDLGEAQAWVNAQFPDPFDVVSERVRRAESTGLPLPISVQKHLLDRAMEIASRGRPMIGTPEADAKLSSAEGSIFLLHLAIRRNEPGFTVDDARRFHAKQTLAEQAKARAASGIDLVAGDGPKAPTPGGPATA